MARQAQKTDHPVILALVGEPAPEKWDPPNNVDVAEQVGPDLGSRMHHAFSQRFAAGAQAVILIGSDLPGISSELIMSGFAALDTKPVVLGPAMDGGYWLLGQREPGYDLFSAIPWSSQKTAEATRGRCAEIQLPLAELPWIQDLDTGEDFETIVLDSGLDDTLKKRLLAAVEQV